MYVWVVVSYVMEEEGVTIESIFMAEGDADQEVIELGEFYDNPEILLEVVPWWAG